ncbi:zinc finger protein pita [Anabrus simplex]|uniref:zinc finger protein pita n=1 Tax=Anabrus simplex TaxID=316456 RepID=UPI0035A27756
MKTYSRKKPIDKLKIDYGFDNVCRLCLSSDREKRFIFTSKEEVPLSAKIMACAPVEVFEGDGLPAEICLLCVQQLENAYKFRQKCLSSDIKLREFTKNSQSHVKVSCGNSNSISHTSEDIQVKSELSIKTVLYDLLSDVDNCKELNTTSCTLTVSDVSGDSLLMDCENSHIELVQSDDVMLIQNIQTALQSSNNNEEEVRENRQDDNEPKDSQRLGEAIAAGFEILDHNHSMEEVQIQSKNYEKSENSCLVLEAAENHAIVSNESTCINISSECSVQEQEKTSVISKSDSTVLPSSAAQQNSVKPTLFFQCEKCHKKFSKRIDLKRHSSVHDEHRGVVCDVCEKWFPNKTSFKRHERTHTGERPYACMFCPKTFSQDAILSRHIMTHTGIKPYKCAICDKGFTQRDGLKLHARRHSNEKPEIQQHGCPLCNKFFCHQSGLSRHLITHTGKTFDCSVCSRPFTDQSSWKRHYRRHFGHQNKPDQEQPKEVNR